jgi:hypothetical protein
MLADKTIAVAGAGAAQLPSADCCSPAWGAGVCPQPFPAQAPSALGMNESRYYYYYSTKDNIDYGLWTMIRL